MTAKKWKRVLAIALLSQLVSGCSYLNINGFSLQPISDAPVKITGLRDRLLEPDRVEEWIRVAQFQAPPGCRTVAIEVQSDLRGRASYTCF
jgi:hypothetical protein